MEAYTQNMLSIPAARVGSFPRSSSLPTQRLPLRQLLANFIHWKTNQASSCQLDVSCLGGTDPPHAVHGTVRCASFDDCFELPRYQACHAVVSNSFEAMSLFTGTNFLPSRMAGCWADPPRHGTDFDTGMLLCVFTPSHSEGQPDLCAIQVLMSISYTSIQGLANALLVPHSNNVHPCQAKYCA